MEWYLIGRLTEQLKVDERKEVDRWKRSSWKIKQKEQKQKQKKKRERMKGRGKGRKALEDRSVKV